MQKVIYINEIRNYSDYIDQSVIDYINEQQTETYESFDKYSIIAFDWYDINDVDSKPSQIMIYIDNDDIFFICENDESYEVAQKLFVNADTNERALYLFFNNLFKGTSKHMEALEDRISALDDAVIDGTGDDKIREQIVDDRYEVLRLKKYYEQLEFVFEELCDNDNDLISSECLKYFEILRNRSVRLVTGVKNLREFITQVRESYQAQIGIEQNNLMKVFTLVTSIFLPLTLIAGWYGMNLKMPEYSWKYGYLIIISLSIVICIIWIIFFKKKNWFK